jgi:hypothetical protein
MKNIIHSNITKDLVPSIIIFTNHSNIQTFPLYFAQFRFLKNLNME